jgi:hypothetical protein
MSSHPKHKTSTSGVISGVDQIQRIRLTAPINRLTETHTISMTMFRIGYQPGADAIRISDRPPLRSRIDNRAARHAPSPANRAPIHRPNRPI